MNFPRSVFSVNCPTGGVRQEQLTYNLTFCSMISS